MIKPFATIPQLSNRLPSPDELKTALTNASRNVYEAFARLWLTEGFPTAFTSAPAIYEDLRGWLASQLSVHAKEVTVVGSARMGYSLKPEPDFGRQFGPRSDLDLGVISKDLFARVASAYEEFSSDLRSGKIAPRSDRERSDWDENVKFGIRNIPRGFFDPDKIPTFNRYPVVQQVGQSMWMLKKKLDVTPGAPQVRKASIRVYRDWQSLIDNKSLNLKSVLRA